MKIRSGFVSNSSSSSFVVSLKDISARDFKHILEYRSDVSGEDAERMDYWSFTVDDEKEILRGFTTMDNGDLEEYLKEKDISDEKFIYENY
jgi:hypothetical protein